MSDHTRQLPPVPVEAAERLQALERMPFSLQLAALLRGDYTSAEWRLIHTRAERLKLLFWLDDGEQFDSLRARCFSLDEWCEFACRHPHRVFKLHGEFAFITVATPEWCER